MIPKETIDKIFESVKIEEIIGDFVSLKKKGVNYIGNCPFHNEKTPSFTVSPTKGIYKCFGCGVGGNAVKFIMEIEHYSYPEALKFIAKKYNIEIVEKELTNAQKKKQGEKDALYAVTQFANTFFQNTLWQKEEGKLIAMTYFQERGFEEETIKKFELGYSGKIKDALTQNAMKSGFEENVLIKSGLSINTTNKKYIDRFHERVIFPIHSFSGRVLGFGGRSLLVNKKAKYLNSPESLIYYKSKVLYGLYQSKSSIAKENNCFIVEGYTDVISMHQNGINNVVSASGTALSLDQLKLINRITENITLLFDGDNAGVKATYRTINLALEQGMTVKVVMFPEGEDPDSYSKKNNINEFKSYLTSNSLDFVDYKIIMSKLNSLSNPKEIINSKRDIFNSIAKIPDRLIRAQYCKIYYKKLDISEEIMLKEVSRAKRAINTTDSKDEIISAKREKKDSVERNNYSITKEDKRLNTLEKELIRLLLNYGNQEFTIKNERTTVAEMIINDLTADKIKFSSPELNILYERISKEIKEKGEVDTYYFINTNLDISDMVIDLISNKHSISENWEEKHNIFTIRENERMKKTTEKAILSLKKAHVDLQISLLQKQINTPDFTNSDIQKLSALTKIKNEIAKSLGRNVG